ncbi:MAG TPA: GGDEF domain-containing protein [Peptococcaceae bacterium]|nr:GGDEF domain-containing protein [Peptococcaceae bacterium]
MANNLLLTLSVRYWQEFQDTLSKVMDANIYIFDAQGNPFSQFSLPIELCREINKGETVTDSACLDFYRTTFNQLKDRELLTCPRGIKLCVYSLGNYMQNLGYMLVTLDTGTAPFDREKEMVLKAKAYNAYRTINEVLSALLEKNLLGLQRLELNSIYEISRLMTSITELDKVLDLITNALIIIYQADLCFVGLRIGDKIRIAQAKGESGHLLGGKEWALLHPVIERVFSQIEPSLLTVDELRKLTGVSHLEVSSHTEIILYPLWTALGIVGLLGIVVPMSLGENGKRNLQIYANFAAVALANATLVSRLEEEAKTDFLTGFLNKRALGFALVEELQRAATYGYPVSVIFIDLDDFKSYNDTFGHLAGDVVLQKAAEIIKSCIRVTDIACRHGGEEFVIILPGTGNENALKVAERILNSLENHPFPHRRITASIGVATSRVGDSLDSLLRRSDEACYMAKKMGKNRVYNNN